MLRTGRAGSENSTDSGRHGSDSLLVGDDGNEQRRGFDARQHHLHHELAQMVGGCDVSAKRRVFMLHSSVSHLRLGFFRARAVLQRNDDGFDEEIRVKSHVGRC